MGSHLLTSGLPAVIQGCGSSMRRTSKGFAQGFCVAVGSPAEPASSAAQTVIAWV
jgi:hypothetical protein